MHKPQQRERFITNQDWNNYLIANNGKEINFLTLRQQCYKEIELLRGRPLLVYASKLNDIPQGAPNSIDLSDIDGFTDLVNSTENTNSVDVLIHSPGGRPDATERIVNILHEKFDEVHFLIPHSAYSAATMLSLAGSSITLHPSATLGPIDPQIHGIPARSIKRGFEKAKEVIANEGPQSLPAYIPLIEKYTLELLEICEDSEKLSKELATTWLKNYMFKGQKNMSKQIKKAADYLSNYDEHLLHSRPLSLDKLNRFGLKINLADKNLQTLLWEAYILLNGFFSISSFIKLYENADKLSWGKQIQILDPTRINSQNQHA